MIDTRNQVIQECQRIKDNTSSDETLVFKYVINGKTSQPVKYRILSPLGGKISGSFLSAIKSTISETIEVVSEDDSVHRLTEVLSDEDIETVVKELYSYLEEHYLFDGLSKNQLSKTIYKESIIVAVPYSEKVVFIYKGRLSLSEGDVEPNLMLYEGLAFYGAFCSDTFYFKNKEDKADFVEFDYPVTLLSFDDLEAKIISDVRIRLKKTIKGSELNLPCQQLSEEMRLKLYKEYSHIALSHFDEDSISEQEHYLTLFPTDKAKTRLSLTTNICRFLADPEGFALRESKRHISENWEQILYFILLHRQVSCEIARLKGMKKCDNAAK